MKVMRERSEERELRSIKSVLPLLIVDLVFWGAWILVVLFVDPAVMKDFLIADAYLLFFVLLFVAVWLLATLLLWSTRKGLWIALTIITYLFLRLKGIGSVFNLILLILFFGILEMFFNSTKKRAG